MQMMSTVGGGMQRWWKGMIYNIFLLGFIVGKRMFPSTSYIFDLTLSSFVELVGMCGFIHITVGMLIFNI